MSCAPPYTNVVAVCRPQFDYDNGVGSPVDRFSIDLYTSDGTGDCGTFVTSICDKESIGCKDSSEFFQHFVVAEFYLASPRHKPPVLLECDAVNFLGYHSCMA